MLKRCLFSLGLLPIVTVPAEGQQLRDLFQRSSRSVVVVRTAEKTLSAEPGKGLVSAGGLGSGTIIASDGTILTAAHVVQTADKVAVQLQDGRSFMARVVASSPRADVALLKMESPPADLAAARLGNSDSLLTGDQIAIVGAPYGLSYTFTVGHVSGRHRVKETINGIPMEFIQTDASINQGNSGGPMFNMAGEVVGVVSYILSQSGGFEGLGFAVSSKVAEKLLITTGSFWTGVEGLMLTGELARALNVPQPAGILIQRVADGSPGAALGLRAGTVLTTIQEQKLLLGGDIVLEIGSIKVSEEAGIEDRVEQYLRSLGPGRPLAVKVLRGGSIATLTATSR